MLYRYVGLEVLLQKDPAVVLSVTATTEWEGSIIGEVRWGDSLSEVSEALRSLGEPIHGDRGPTTLAYLSVDGSYGVVLVFDESDRLTEARLTRQVPGSDYQGV